MTKHPTMKGKLPTLVTDTQDTESGPKVVASGPNDIVADLMRAKGVSGKSADHIIIFANGDLMDHDGRSYEARDTEGNLILPDLGKGVKLAVIHRSKLWEHIGPGSKQFWHQGRPRSPRKQVIESKQPAKQYSENVPWREWLATELRQAAFNEVSHHTNQTLNRSRLRQIKREIAKTLASEVKRRGLVPEPEGGWDAHIKALVDKAVDDMNARILEKSGHRSKQSDKPA